jgi:hypothetical protein
MSAQKIETLEATIASQTSLLMQREIQVDKLANLVASIAVKIDETNLPNKFTFSYVVSNWRKLSGLIADIVKLIKNYKAQLSVRSDI